ncbi:DUF1249 domain-containing protein [Aliagarivorans marinus]|uniref:DUF1249 domain-containing protein n=1 Tax=Aliagarivorans marinus TaxID=561965 RepID=UPI0004251E5A|nr:DUF1249 domain-containing protein [Aliagarivorans marinus]
MGRKYHVNLDQLMQLYSANYILLNRLFPMDEKAGSRLDVSTLVGSRYLLHYLEQTRYTSLLQITQAGEGQLAYLQPHLLVRLYHDARLAEVCASQQIYRLQPRYDYPNKKMLHRDEKHQVNQFLNDWLAFCLKQRISIEPSTGSDH